MKRISTEMGTVAACSGRASSASCGRAAGQAEGPTGRAGGAALPPFLPLPELLEPQNRLELGVQCDPSACIAIL